MKSNKLQCPCCTLFKNQQEVQILFEQLLLSKKQILKSEEVNIDFNFVCSLLQSGRIQWACDDCLKNGKAIVSDPNKMNYTVSPNYLAYFDKKIKCHTCKEDFIFSSQEQQYWFEVLSFWHDSYPTKCPTCRKEIREQKAIAYSTYAAFTTPERKNENHFLQAFVGTQSDKMETAMTEMLKLLNKMPRVEKQYENARNSTIKQIASDRITKENIFWRNEALKKMGFEKDFREAVYNDIKATDMDKFEKFFNANIANKNFTYVILGDKTKINFEALKKVGEVKEMTPLEVFAY